MTDRTDALVSLRFPGVRPLALGQQLSTLAGQMQAVAVGWQLYEQTHSAWALAATGLVSVVPAVVLALPAGHVVDRHDRRRVAVLALLARAVAAAGLAVAAWQGASVSIVYAMLFLSGIGTAFGAPAVGSLLPELIPPEHFANANAWLGGGRQLSAMAGPAVAGALIALTGGAVTVFVVEALCFCIFAGIILGLPPRRGGARERETSTTLSEMFAGLRFVFGHDIFLAAITLDLFAVLLGGATALLPIFAKDILHAGPLGLGLLRSAPAAGALLTALVLTRLAPWRRPGTVLLWTVAGFGAATIGFGLSRSFVASLFFLALTGLFDQISVVIRLTLEQALTPDRMRGRVGAVHWVFIGLSNELGAFESGATAAMFGPIWSVVGGGLGTLLVVALVAAGWRSLRGLAPLAELRALDD